MSPVSMKRWAGYRVNPARNNGEDLEPDPVITMKFREWAGIQLFNGVAGLTQFRFGPNFASWAQGFYVPGSQRMVPAGYPLIGPAPSQVQDMYQRGAGSQARTPGGPGQFLDGYTFINPGG